MAKDKTINVMDMRITYVVKSTSGGGKRQYNNRSKILICEYIDSAPSGTRLKKMIELSAALLVSKPTISRWRKDYNDKLIPNDCGYLINRRPEIHTTMRDEISELRRRIGKRKSDISMIVKTAEIKVIEAQNEIAVDQKELDFLEMAASRGFSQTHITINQ